MIGLRCPLILAHGANNNLDFPLLAYLGRHLAETGAATVVRFNFPYVERGVTSPDPRPVLEGHLRARSTDHVIDKLAPPGDAASSWAASPWEAVRPSSWSLAAPRETVWLAAGLIVLGYPLHAMGREDRLWVEPLRHIDVPSLFFIGTRDSLCDPELLRPILARLDHPGELHVVEGGDHSLHLPRIDRQTPRRQLPGGRRRGGDVHRADEVMSAEAVRRENEAPRVRRDEDEREAPEARRTTREGR